MKNITVLYTEDGSYFRLTLLCSTCCYFWCAELQFCVVMMQRNLRNVASYRPHEPAGYYCSTVFAERWLFVIIYCSSYDRQRTLLDLFSVLCVMERFWIRLCLHVGNPTHNSTHSMSESPMPTLTNSNPNANRNPNPNLTHPAYLLTLLNPTN